MTRVRTTDSPAFQGAVARTLIGIRPQLEELARALPMALYLGAYPDHLHEVVQREVMNEIGRVLFAEIAVPPVPPYLG